MKKKRIGLGAIVVILVILVACFGTLVNFITDYLWFRELGYTSVFFKQLFTQLKLGIPTFAIITGLTYLYLMALKKGYYKKVETVDTANPPEKTVNLLALGISAVFAVLATLTTVTKLWFEILKFYHGKDFNLADPIFNLDIGFYIFKLEFITHINQILIGIILAFVLVTVIFYFLLVSMRRPQIFERKTEDYADEGEQRYTGNYGSGFGAFGEAMNKTFGGRFGGNNAPGVKMDKDNLKQLVNIASKQLDVYKRQPPRRSCGIWCRFPPGW